jgi:hypothetical protein
LSIPSFKHLVLAIFISTMAFIPVAIANTESFAQMVRDIRKDISDANGGDAIDRSEMFLSPKFKAFYMNPDPFREDALVFLSNPDADRHEVLFINVAMNNLRPENLIALSRSLLALVEAGTIGETVLRQQILMNSRFIGMESAEFIAVLKEVANSSAISQKTKSYINDYVFSGKLAKQIPTNPEILPRKDVP